MMEHSSLDPYEQQLLKVFVSHDGENVGSLDKSGLIKLCETLQLEEKSSELIKALLTDHKTRATFNEFKDALLKLLGNMQNIDDVPVDASPEREVSPKFVYGSKKYGRRSRPREELNLDQNDFNSNNKTNSVSVQRSNSQHEVTYSKKRKTNARVKRCTSFPGDHKKQDEIITASLTSDLICTEDMLKEAWRKLGVGENGFLNKNELILVCDAIGLNKLAESVIRQLSGKFVYNKKISFQELLDALKQDETWNEILNYSNDSDLEIHEIGTNIETSFHNLKMLQHIKLGPDGTGFINFDLIIELWEQAGILSPKSLLMDLGFKEQLINVFELSTVLEKEIKGLNELRIDHTCNPHVALLQAFLTLYQTEIKCLKNILEQMHDEREKLKCDVYEANNRATLLAQEVDDSVAKMELSTKNHVKLLEQRHSDILKDVTEQYSSDKEQMALLNQRLECKIQNLESEEMKLRDDLDNAQKYSNQIETENTDLSKKIIELEEANDALKRQIQGLEIEKIKFNDLEVEKREKLLAKISDLQLENTTLRDKHDEMVSKIEILTNENISLKGKSSNLKCDGDTLDENIHDGLGLGSKRRSFDSPSKDLVAMGLLGDSPCLGKVRKYKTEALFCDSQTINESGCYEEDFEKSGTSSQSSAGEETNFILARIKCLEQILKEHSIEIPSTFNQIAASDSSTPRTPRSTSPTNHNVLTEIKKQLEELRMKEDKDMDDIYKLIEKFLADNEKQVPEQNDDDDALTKLEKEKGELVKNCERLEDGLELLRNEYDKCEDYWQKQIDDERHLFEQEQIQNSEKLNELLNKLGEYEEQFLKDSRLPTIDESANLEQQFLDLEQEFEEYKDKCEKESEEKDAEIFALKEKLTQDCDCADASIQADFDDNKHSNLTFNVIDSMDIYSADTLPFDWNNKVEPNIAKSNLWNNETNSLPTTWNHTKAPPLPSTSETELHENNSMPFRQKRTRYHDKYISQGIFQKRNKAIKTENPANQFNGNSSEQKCWVPIDLLNNLQSKKLNLEQRCKKLQLVLKQQHLYDEQLLHYSWQQYSTEKAELQHYIKFYQDQLKQQIRLAGDQQERLAKNDLLVKDLFVDNAYLMAKNQRLEQQCHILANNLNTNSV